MKKLFLIPFLFFAALQSGRAQVKITTDTSSKDYILIGENTSHIPYSVIIHFTQLENMVGPASQGQNYEAICYPGKKRLIKFSRIEGMSPRLRYTSTAHPGNVFSKVDTMFLYQMPLKAGKKTLIRRVGDLESFLDRQKPRKTMGLSFQMEEGDTIYACRSGIVCTMKSADRTSSDSLHLFSNSYLSIYHKDGSTAFYRGFEKDRILVKEGDRVITGQPLGVVAGKRYTRNMRATVSFTYHTLQERTDYSTPAFKSHHFMPLFVGEQGEAVEVQKTKTEPYRVYHSQDLILSEMSKSEKKKYLKKTEVRK